MFVIQWDELRDMLLDYDTYISRNGIPGIKELVEINVSCPNKLDIKSGSLSQIIAYNPLELSRLLESIKSLELHNINIGLKLSPYIDKILLIQIANIINHYQQLIKYIVCGNSIPNGMLIDINTGNPILSVKTGGISGITNRLIGVSNVYQFNDLFHKLDCQNIVIMGCGGIEKANDILEYIKAGAKGVQIGRVLYIEGVSKLNNIWNNLSSKL